MASLPVDGDTGWGDTLNVYLANLTSEANSTQSGLNSHAANSPADPHGDRAYTQSLVNPITTGTNLPNGYVQLNSLGAIPASLITTIGTGGLYNGVIDAVTMYGATPGTGSDQSVVINNALAACGAAGGGIVYLGPGVFSLSRHLTIRSNTWLLMSPGTILRRIPGSPNASVMISNIAFTSSSTPATDIIISGGTIDMYGTAHVTSSCEGIFIFRSNSTILRDISFTSPFNAGPAIELNGCSGTLVDGCQFTGISGGTTGTFPAIRFNTASVSSTFSGMNPAYYDDTAVFSCIVSGCIAGPEVTASAQVPSPYGYFAGSDRSGSFVAHQNIVISGNSSYYVSSGGGTFFNGYPVQNIDTWTGYAIHGNAWTDLESGGWITMSLVNGFTAASTGFPPQYQITSDGYIHVYGALKLPSSYNGITVSTMPVHPAHTAFSNIAYTSVTAPTAMPYVSVNTSGNIILNNLPSGLNGTNVYMDISFPINASGILI